MVKGTANVSSGGRELLPVESLESVRLGISFSKGIVNFRPPVEVSCNYSLEEYLNSITTCKIKSNIDVFGREYDNCYNNSYVVLPLEVYILVPYLLQCIK